MEYYPKFYYRLETMERQYIFYMTILMIFRNVRREPGLKKNGLSERLQTEKQNITLNIVNFYTKTTSRQIATQFRELVTSPIVIYYDEICSDQTTNSFLFYTYPLQVQSTGGIIRYRIENSLLKMNLPTPQLESRCGDEMTCLQILILVFSIT